MAGHSKWANIQHRKGRQDEKRGKIWTRIIREITVAARAGGGDLAINPRLRLAVERAKAANLPADRVKYNIDKATGNQEGVHYEEIRYEGYGIGGAAILVDTMTDNKVRTVAEVRHAFSKHGGNMGTEGSVVFQFKHCGQLIFAPGTNEDKVMEVALEAGAEDVITDDDGAIEVLTAYADFETVKNALEAAGLTPEMAEVTMRPENPIELSGDDAVRMQKLLDVLEELDDTQNIYHNAHIDSSALGKFLLLAAVAVNMLWPGNWPSRPRCKPFMLRPATVALHWTPSLRTSISPMCMNWRHGRRRTKSR